MKRTTIAKRLEKIKINKTSFAYKAVSLIAKNDLIIDIIRPCHTSGKGRFTTNLDYTSQVCNLLDSLKVRYNVGNDAPRGAISGNYIKILNLK